LVKRTKKKYLNLLLNLGNYLPATAIGFALNYYMGYLFYFLAFAVLIGLLLPKLIINKWGHKEKVFNKIVWLNLILGLFYTPIGVLFGVFTIKYNTLLSKKDRSNLYKTLGIIGISISLLNSFIAMLTYYFLSK